METTELTRLPSRVEGFASRWLSNSVANLIGGVSAALFNIALPAVVSRHLTNPEFSSWSLAMQIVAYVNLLGLGLQTATARVVARANERGDRRALGRTVKAANAIGHWASLCGFAAVALLLAALPLVFPNIPAELSASFRWALLFIGGSAALKLLALVPMGVFQGMHKNARFVSAQVVIRVVTFALLVMGVAMNLGLIGLALTFACGMALLVPVIGLQLRRAFPWLASYRESVVDSKSRRELLEDCITLSVWNISMLLVNTVGIVMVGRIAFSMSGAYSIAMTAATVLAGLLEAIFSPLLTTAAAMHALPERRAALPSLLNKSTMACTIALHVLFLLIYLSHKSILQIWVGPSFVQTVGPLLLVLTGAYALRSVGSPYAFMLLATGLNRRALWTAVAEGIGNLAATIALGLRFGVLGIAYGSLAGSVIGILGALVFNTPRTTELTPKPASFIWRGLVLPTLIVTPLYWFILKL